jgi:aminodeoxychorismate synthase component I
MSLPAPPFVLLDDARTGGTGVLYTDAAAIVTAHDAAGVEAALARLAGAAAQGLHAAGSLTYEAGYALEPSLTPLLPALAQPLLWFGLFRRREAVADVPALLGAAVAPTADPVAQVTRADHAAAMARILDHIVAGDIYQANLTFPAAVPVPADRHAFYAAVRARAAAGHGALVETGARTLLSFSPELFFALDRRQVTTRPMKGTAPRHADPDQDAAAIAALQADPKQRAENLMIVDLLRNDLARVSEPGSVTVPALFAIESYPTVHQMVSTVTGTLRQGLGAVDILRALFPCGSITGAPKIRAMEIIRAVEPAPRGVYTGAIGAIDADGTARFNVAIRTVCVEKEAPTGVLGLGSGIVAESDAASEWRECLTKGRFIAVD